MGRIKEMEKKLTIGKWEAASLLINAMCLQLFLNLPRLMAEAAATAGWMLCLYAGILALAAFAVIEVLYRPFEGKDILDIAEYAAGVPGRVAAGTIIMGHLIYALMVILREFGEDMKVIALVVSPISFVILFFAAGMVMASYMGLEAVVRVHAYSVPIVAAGFLVIAFGVAPYYNPHYVLPLMGNGAYRILIGGIPRISIFSSLILLYLLPPFLGTHRSFRGAGYASIILSMLLMTLGCAVYLMVFPYKVTVESFLPIYQLARLINYGRFFQRIESLFLVIWAAAALLYLSLVFFMLLYTFKRTYGLRYYRPLILPFAVIVFNLSLLPPNLMVAIYLETKYFRNFAALVTFGLTILILAAARIKYSIRERSSEA